MRDFFLNLLNKLDKLAGLKQLDKIYAVHGEDLDGAKKEIKILLDVLCNVSKQFPFIPEYEQQKIITHCVVSEEFNSLNGNVVYRWLAKHKDKYFKESHHLENQEPTAEPVTGEARQKWIKEWLGSLASAEQMIVGGVTENELKQEKRRMRGQAEWLRDRARDPGYLPPSIEEVKAHALHLEYCRKNFDKYTGDKLSGWKPENEWIDSLSDQDKKLIYLNAKI